MSTQSLINSWKSQRNILHKKFKAFISFAGKKQLKQLDAKAINLHHEVFSEINCLECAACCKGIPPIVNKNDVQRISKYLNIKPVDFQNTYLIIDEDGDSVMKTTPCVFLGDGNLCQIYTVRPKACKAYPHTDNYNFSKSPTLHLTNIKHCPAVYHIVERILHQK